MHLWITGHSSASSSYKFQVVDVHPTGDVAFTLGSLTGSNHDDTTYSVRMQQWNRLSGTDKYVTFACQLESINLSDFAGAILVVFDSSGKVLSVDNMYDKPLIGTDSWRNVSMALSVPRNAAVIGWGIYMYGSGILNIRFPSIALHTQLPLNVEVSSRAARVWRKFTASDGADGDVNSSDTNRAQVEVAAIARWLFPNSTITEYPKTSTNSTLKS